MSEITAKDFEKLDLRVGKIKAVKKHPQTDDYILLVDIGPIGADKQIVANLKKYYTMKDLMNKKVCVNINAKPTVVKGIESIGWLLIAHEGKKPVLIEPGNFLPGIRICGLNNKEITYQD